MRGAYFVWDAKVFKGNPNALDKGTEATAKEDYILGVCVGVCGYESSSCASGMIGSVLVGGHDLRL